MTRTTPRSPESAPEVDRWRDLEILARAVVDGSPGGWHDLLAALEPQVLALARRSAIGRLRDRPDDRRAILVRVFEKLHAGDHRYLRSYFAREPRPSFAGWLRRIVASAAIDHLRGHPEFVRHPGEAGDDGELRRWISLVTLASGDGRPGGGSLADLRDRLLGDLEAVMARLARVWTPGEIEALGRALGVAPLHLRRLKKRRSEVLPVVQGILAGMSQREVAVRLELSRRDVELTVGYVEELLRELYRAAREVSHAGL